MIFKICRERRYISCISSEHVMCSKCEFRKCYFFQCAVKYSMNDLELSPLDLHTIRHLPVLGINPAMASRQKFRLRAIKLLTIT